MTCQFLENLTLRSLIAPVSEDEFRTRYWEKEPMIVHREDLFTLQDFDEALTRAPSYVKVADATTKKNKALNTGAAPDLEAILANMRDGSTLILDGLHRQDPKLARLCALFGPEFGHRFQTNLYLTPPHGKGFTPHWDNHDVFIIQVVGSKNWHIEKTRRVFPAKYDKIGEEGRELVGDTYSFTLKQGDLIYIPRGFVHAAECGSEPSLHITLGLGAIFLETLLYATIKTAIQRDERLRVALPLGFMNGNHEGVISRISEALREAADETLIGTVLDQFKDELVKTFPLDVSGQVVDFFQPPRFTLEDSVGPRRGIVYRTHPGEDSVRLNFGGRSIVFPGFFREALEFALKTSTFAIRDLPGELEDGERIVFIERLLQEGVVVRK